MPAMFSTVPSVIGGSHLPGCRGQQGTTPGDRHMAGEQPFDCSESRDQVSRLSETNKHKTFNEGSLGHHNQICASTSFTPNGQLARSDGAAIATCTPFMDGLTSSSSLPGSFHTESAPSKPVANLDSKSLNASTSAVFSKRRHVLSTNVAGTRVYCPLSAIPEMLAVTDESVLLGMGGLASPTAPLDHLMQEPPVVQGRRTSSRTLARVSLAATPQLVVVWEGSLRLVQGEDSVGARSYSPGASSNGFGQVANGNGSRSLVAYGASPSTYTGVVGAHHVARVRISVPHSWASYAWPRELTATCVQDVDKFRHWYSRGVRQRCLDVERTAFSVVDTADEQLIQAVMQRKQVLRLHEGGRVIALRFRSLEHGNAMLLSGKYLEGETSGPQQYDDK